VDDLLTYQQASSLLQVPVSTLYGWVHTRSIPHLRLGKRTVRFRKGELVTFLDHSVVAPRLEERLP
jgi:excisionase family DNA binding protein